MKTSNFYPAEVPSGAACCPTCGRRFRLRVRSRAPAPMPLFAWATSQGERRPAPRFARVALLDTHRDAEGQPRPALLIPGRAPVVFGSIAAALAAQRCMEGWR